MDFQLVFVDIDAVDATIVALVANSILCGYFDRGDKYVQTEQPANGQQMLGREQRYQAERWRAPREPSETVGRPNPEPSCRRPEMAPDWACLVAAR